MSVAKSYRMRLQRKRWRIRALRKRRELASVCDRTRQIQKKDIILFATLRDEKIRLPFFLRYYRKLGVNHFIFVDNGSKDGTGDFLKMQGDVTLFSTNSSYRSARFGTDWLNWLQRRYAHGHWALTVDADEFFVYPFCDTRPLQALTDWLDSMESRAFSAMQIDLYPRGDIQEQAYREGQNPLDIVKWFDSANYMISKNADYKNLWIQGGPRARMFFADDPASAPALNKIPLVKWHQSYVYANSTHMLLPRGLNIVYDEHGGEKPSGALLHAKFLNTFVEKADEEMTRGQHYLGSREYQAYKAGLNENASLWCKWSEEYINWRQLEMLGLLSKGNWA